MARTTAAPERIRADAAALVLGVTTRCVQALAARGEVPGACKIGKLWTFDETALRNWIKERSTCPEQKRQGSPSGAAMSYGRDLPLQARNSAKASELALQRLRRGA
jgi:hypothetical protein